ncbi:MAG: hypothetical protein PHU77_04845 [Simplicispira sp.]|nr:hypothetical protein [Simplicispira sp.]
MSDTTPFGFGKLVPGFDFLQNLAKGATGSIPKMPSLSSWVAPTLSVEELDKRVDELKAVQFWLEQNSRALSATIQALEVQKMTLATLQGMNFNMGDVANAFKLKTTDSLMGGVQKFGETLAGAAHSFASPTARTTDAESPREQDKNKSEPDKNDSGKSDSGKSHANVVDPMQWWGALTQQFQQIATSALADAAKQTAFDPSKGAAATDLAKDAFKAATDMASQLATQGVQSVQDATRRATSLASAAVTAPILSATPPAAKKITAARNTTAAKSSTPKSAAPAAKKPAARKAAPVAPAKKSASGRGATKSAR